MKTKFFTLLVFSILLTACSKDETNESPQEEANLTTSITLTDEANTETTRSNSRITCVLSHPTTNCEPYKPRIINFRDRVEGEINVTYKSTLSLEEVACIRRAYFICFPNLRMAFVQDSDPYKDNWKTIDNGDGEVGGAGSVAQTVDDDDERFGD